jgi:hypothetical protein
MDFFRRFKGEIYGNMGLRNHPKMGISMNIIGIEGNVTNVIWDSWLMVVSEQESWTRKD